MIKYDGESPPQMLQFVLVTHFVYGILSVVAGLFCHSGFCYLAALAAIPEPSLWISISLVFVLRQVATVLSAFRLKEQ